MRVRSRRLLATLAAMLASADAQAAGDPASAHRDHAWLRFEHGATNADPPPASLGPERRNLLASGGHGWVETLDRWQIDLGRDGTLEERHTLVRTLLSDEGVRQAGTLSFDVNADLETVTIEHAYALLPGGERNPVDRARIEVQTNPQSGAFSDAYFVSLPYAGLAKGATLVLVYTKRSQVDQWPLPWSRHYLARTLVPREEFSLEVRWSEGLATPTWATDSNDLHCETKSDRTLRCSQFQVAPVNADPDVRSWLDLLPQLVVTAPQDWAALAERERAIVDAALTDAPEIAALGARLTEGATSQIETLRRIHRFVADEIRYVAFEHGRSAVIPRRASETLRLRFGDCKDKVTLFLALARHAGLDAYAVLVGANRYDRRRLITPSAGYFDHMIACVRDLWTTPICIDLTSSDAPTGELPMTLDGAVALELRAGASEPGSLPSSRVAWNLEARTRYELGCDGGVLVKSLRIFRGASAVYTRGILRAMSVADRKRWAIDDYRQAIDDRVAPEVEFVGLEDVGAPIEVRTFARVPNVLSLESGNEYVESDAWLVHYAAQLASRNHYHPFELVGLRMRALTELRLCDRFVVEFAGPKLELHSPFGGLHRELHWTDSELVSISSFEFARQRIEVSDLQRFNDTLRSALQQTRIWFRYRNRAPESSGPS